MAIVHIDFRTISWGGPNEDDSNDVWQVEDGSNDPGEIVLEDFGTVGTPINGFPAPPTIGPAANPYKFPRDRETGSGRNDLRLVGGILGKAWR